jgi:hypothetical protein
MRPKYGTRKLYFMKQFEYLAKLGLNTYLFFSI